MAGRGQRMRRVVAAGLVAVGLVAVGLVAVGCAPTSGGSGGTGDPLAMACGGATVGCRLPFPSERWLVADPTTATGVRVRPPADEAASLDAFGPGAAGRQAITAADGFSATGPVVFQFPVALDDQRVAALAGSDLVRVTDTTTGRAVRVRTERSPLARLRPDAAGIVLVWPAWRFEFGHHISVEVRRGFRAADGSLVPGPDGSDVLAATSFTVRSRASVTDGLDRRVAAVRADDHPFRNWAVASQLDGAFVVTGQVRLTELRDAVGVIAPDAAVPTGHPWVDVTILLPPEAATAGRAPVLLYGHGAGVFKESLVLAAGAARVDGRAVIAIDRPAHGSRSLTDGTFLDLARAPRAAEFAGTLQQSVLDEVALARAIDTHLGQLDVLPLRPDGSAGGDGLPDVDASQLVYAGPSLGGILGGSVGALAPELDGVALQVAGSGWVDVMLHNTDSLNGFGPLLPSGWSAGDAHLALGLLQLMVDPADPDAVVDRLAASGRPVLVEYSPDDGLVVPPITHRLLRGLDLPVMTAEAGATVRLPADLAGRRVNAVPADGRVVAELTTWDLAGGALRPLAGHLSFFSAEAQRVLAEWLAVTRQPDLGVGGAALRSPP